MHLRSLVILLTISIILSACAGMHQQETRTTALPAGKGVASEDASTVSSVRIQLEDDAVPTLDDPLVDPHGHPLVDLDVPLTEAEQKALDEPVRFQFVLDIRETKEVERYFRYFTHDARSRFAAWLKRSEQYLPAVRDIFQEHDLPHDLIYLPFVESGYNPMAYSRAGAGGMWQFMPGTGRLYGLTFDWWVDQRRDPLLSTHAAAQHLAKLHDMFNDWHLALAAYNAGEGRISRAMRRSGTDNYFDLAAINNLLATETRHYVPKLMAILKIIQNLEELGFEPINWDNAPSLAVLDIKGGTDLVALAEHTGLSWDEFRRYNPLFRRQVSPPDMKLSINLPQTHLAAAREYLSKPNSNPFEGFQRYRVQRGDSWWVLSSRFSTPITVLKRINNRRSNTLRIGESLMVPRSASSTVVQSSGRSNYIVQSGDNLWNISRTHGVSVGTLVQANNLSNKHRLKVGQRLYIPNLSGSASRAASTSQSNKVVEYRVRSGDTLWQIARRFGVTTNNLVAWNRLPRNGLIRPGDNLKIFVP
jgi:membrane-bound lytic murein transglycosylase D